MRVLAVDPGGATGMALWEGDSCTVHGCEHVEFWTEPNPMGAIDRARVELLGLHALVVEEFTINSTTAHKTRGGTMQAIEIIGALRYLAWRRGAGIQFILQKPADAKSFVTDVKLKRIGWYTPGKDHPRDAARHLALYLTRAGLMSPERLLPSEAKEGE